MRKLFLEFIDNAFLRRDCLLPLNLTLWHEVKRYVPGKERKEFEKCLDKFDKGLLSYSMFAIAFNRILHFFED